MAEMSVAEMSIGRNVRDRNVRGRNVLAETSVAEMSVVEMSEHRSGAVLYGHKAVQCDKCEMWIHNKCSLITESEFDSVENTNCTWICPKCDF